MQGSNCSSSCPTQDIENVINCGVKPTRLRVG
nr:MAG TPA: hypothetical protein [Caudoviricetes sp.]